MAASDYTGDFLPQQARGDLLRAIEEVVRTVVAEPVTLREDMFFAEAADWDSMTQTRMMVAVESRFGVLFTIDELATLTTVRSVLDAVQQKLLTRSAE